MSTHKSAHTPSHNPARKASRKLTRKRSAPSRPLVSITPVGHYRAAWDATKAERQALAPEDEWPIKLHVPDVIVAVLGAIPHIASLRSEIEEQLPKFDLTLIDKLPTFTSALAFSQAMSLSGFQSGKVLLDLVERGSALRTRLLADGTALVTRGLLDGQFLEQLKGGHGYFNIGLDLGAIVETFRKSWSAIEGKTGVTLEELQQGELLYEQITSAMAARARPSQDTAAMADERVRAYSLVIGAYDQIRRAVSYLRWNEEDVDKYLPSLYGGRRSRGSAKAAAASGDGSAANGAEPPAPTNGASTTPATPAAAVPPGAGGTPMKIGMRDSSPFTND